MPTDALSTPSPAEYGPQTPGTIEAAVNVERQFAPAPMDQLAQQANTLPSNAAQRVAEASRGVNMAYETAHPARPVREGERQDHELRLVLQIGRNLTAVRDHYAEDAVA